MSVLECSVLFEAGRARKNKFPLLYLKAHPLNCLSPVVELSAYSATSTKRFGNLKKSLFPLTHCFSTQIHSIRWYDHIYPIIDVGTRRGTHLCKV